MKWVYSGGRRDGGAAVVLGAFGKFSKAQLFRRKRARWQPGWYSFPHLGDILPGGFKLVQREVWLAPVTVTHPASTIWHPRRKMICQLQWVERECTVSSATDPSHRREPKLGLTGESASPRHIPRDSPRLRRPDCSWRCKAAAPDLQ